MSDSPEQESAHPAERSGSDTAGLEPLRPPPGLEPPGSLEDETVVVARAADETVVVQRAAAGEDRTVVVRREEHDETIVAQRGQSELTIVAPRAPHRGSADGRREVPSESGSGSGSRGSGLIPETVPIPEAMPVPIAPGLDPTRPIAPAPGANPWDEPPSGERGVAQGIPVTYGVRPTRFGDYAAGDDEVLRRIGPPPEETPVPLREGRQQLPSLLNRDRRGGRTTLVLYAGAILVSVLGLWGLAHAAFGW